MQTLGLFRATYSDTVGRRPSMEDKIAIILGYRGNTTDAYFAVFDGHGGTRSSHFAAENHPGILASYLDGGDATKQDFVIECIKKSVKDCNELMTSEKVGSSGTTALIAVALNRTLYVANLGDSRAIAARRGKQIALTHDHKPNHQDEEKRIRNDGGWVNANGRVMGRLAVSRAMGDLDFQPVISADADVKVLGLEEPLDFLVMACDGVWDLISNEAAVKIVGSESDITRASIKLRDFAVLLGSEDNISVIVITWAMRPGQKK